MLDISRLRTSLTKEGAYKIALLLQKYDKDKVLGSLSGVEPGINIEHVQASANLSASVAGVVPNVWNKARKAGVESIRGLTLLAIIFSHRDLIAAMIAGRTGVHLGTINKGVKIGGKAFTNFKHTLYELGYVVSQNSLHVSYNLKRLFEIPGFSKLAAELISLKLKTAGWDGKGSIADTMIAADLHKVLAISPKELREWITPLEEQDTGDTLEDEAFFLGSPSDDGLKPSPFVFTPGHKQKKTGTIDVNTGEAGYTSELLHNALQTALYSYLVEQHGKKCVGTEQPTAYGTTIDLVVMTDTDCVFYEIKVAKTIKACIRQAIPQLLEYAYWRVDNEIATKLVIASKFAITRDAAEFMALLRRRFKLPLYYEQIVL